MGTFIGRLKNEIFYGYEKGHRSYEKFSEAVTNFFDYYNNNRIQAKVKTSGLAEGFNYKRAAFQYLIYYFCDQTHFTEYIIIIFYHSR